MSYRTSRALNVIRWHHPARLSGFFALLLLLAPVALAFPSSAAHGDHDASSIISPESGLDLTFTGNDRIIVKSTIDEPASGHRRLGEIYRNDELGDTIRSNNRRTYSLHVDGRPRSEFKTRHLHMIDL